MHGKTRDAEEEIGETSVVLATYLQIIPTIIDITRSGEASPTFGHANAHFSVLIDSIRNQFLIKK